jgi:hypothetical protein
VITAVEPDEMQDGRHEEVMTAVSSLRKWSFIGGVQVKSPSWMRSDGECIGFAVTVAEMMQYWII